MWKIMVKWEENKRFFLFKMFVFGLLLFKQRVSKKSLGTAVIEEKSALRMAAAH